MAEKILILFNLKPGVSAANYDAWATTMELPTVNGLKAVENFEIFKATGLLFSQDKPPYAYFEILDISDRQAFEREVDSAAMYQTVETFQNMVENAIFMTMEAL